MVHHSVSAVVTGAASALCLGAGYYCAYQLGKTVAFGGKVSHAVTLYVAIGFGVAAFGLACGTGALA